MSEFNGRPERFPPALLPLCAVVALAVALLQTGPATGKLTLPPEGLKPVEARDLRLPMATGMQPMQPLISRTVTAPAEMPDHVPGLEDDSVLRKGLSQSDSVSMPLVYVPPAQNDSKDKKDKKKRPGDLSLPDDKENPFEALVPEGMNPNSGWGWLADDIQDARKTAERSAMDSPVEDDLGLSIPGSAPDEGGDDLGLSRASRLQLE